MSFLSRLFAPVGAIASGFAHARRYELLFAKSEAELATRGLDRENLVRGFITGFAYG